MEMVILVAYQAPIPMIVIQDADKKIYHAEENIDIKENTLCLAIYFYHAFHVKAFINSEWL